MKIKKMFIVINLSLIYFLEIYHQIKAGGQENFNSYAIYSEMLNDVFVCVFVYLIDKNTDPY